MRDPIEALNATSALQPTLSPIELGAFETRLVAGLQPIRGFVLAACIHHLFASGTFDLLRGSPGMAAETLAECARLDGARLAGFLKYLANEGLVAWDATGVRLTDSALALEDVRPWFTMLVGGYGRTFLDVGATLKQGAKWAGRDGEQVGIGACGISHYDSIPLTRELMAQIPTERQRLLDLGCGNGLYLVEFCKELPGLTALGVEPDPGSWRAGTELVRRSGMEHRVRLVNAGAVEFLRSNHPYQPDFIVLGFVLHELLGQEGEAGVVAFLGELVRRYPDIYVIVIEVEDKIDDPKVMQHGLARAYYNPYYLLHYITNQKLVSRERWEAIFAAADLEVLAVRGTDPAVDSTGLELGFLLHRR